MFVAYVRLLYIDWANRSLARFIRYRKAIYVLHGSRHVTFDAIDMGRWIYILHVDVIGLHEDDRNTPDS